jgi:hypothetical protein
MFRGTIEFTSDALATILAHHQIGEPHLTMEPEPVWRDPDADGEALRDATAQFARYGLVSEDGRLDEGFRDTLHAACRPHVEYYSWFQVRGELLAVHAAARDGESFVAVRTGTRIRMRRVGPNSLPTELLSELPALRPARFTPISMRLPEAQSARSGRAQGGGYLRTISGTRGAPGETLKELLGYEELGGGEIWVAVRDTLNRRTACPSPVRIVDSAGGRMVSAVTGEGDDAWLLVAPATPQEVQARLGQLRGKLPA